MYASQTLGLITTVKLGHPFYDGIPAGKEEQAAAILEGIGISAPYTGTPLEGWARPVICQCSEEGESGYCPRHPSYPFTL